MVEIIPKPTVRMPLWLNLLFYFSICLVLLVVLSVLVLARFQKKAEVQHGNLREAIAKEQKVVEGLEKEVFLYQRKLDDFSLMLTERRFPLHAFSLLEENSHPRVQFSQLNLNLQQAQAGLSAISESFPALKQQLLIFEKAEKIKRVQLSQVSFGKEGGVDFSVSLSLDPQLFR